MKRNLSKMQKYKCIYVAKTMLKDTQLCNDIT